jgi:hypothetical protein
MLRLARRWQKTLEPNSISLLNFRIPVHALPLPQHYPASTIARDGHERAELLDNRRCGVDESRSARARASNIKRSVLQRNYSVVYSHGPHEANSPQVHRWQGDALAFCKLIYHALILVCVIRPLASNWPARPLVNPLLLCLAASRSLTDSALALSLFVKFASFRSLPSFCFARLAGFSCAIVPYALVACSPFFPASLPTSRPRNCPRFQDRSPLPEHCSHGTAGGC